MHYITYSLYYILEQPVSYISSADIFKSTCQNMFVWQPQFIYLNNELEKTHYYIIAIKPHYV